MAVHWLFAGPSACAPCAIFKKFAHLEIQGSRMNLAGGDPEPVVVVPVCHETEWGGCGTTSGRYLFQTKTGERSCSSPACAF